MFLVCRKCHKTYESYGLMDLCPCGGKGDTLEELYDIKQKREAQKIAKTSIHR